MFNLYDTIPGAPNFKHYELVRSDTATRKGIDNTPKDGVIWKRLYYLATNILQPVRNEFGPIRITSGFRSFELNEAIGGSEKSNHCFGYAVDIEPVNKSIKLFDVLEFIHYNLVYDELIAEYFPYGWIHVAVQMEREEQRKILKLKDKEHSYTKETIDYIRKLYSDV